MSCIRFNETVFRYICMSCVYLLTMMVDCIELTALLATDLEEVDVIAKDLPRISAISLSGLLMIC